MPEMGDEDALRICRRAVDYWTDIADVGSRSNHYQAVPERVRMAIQRLVVQFDEMKKRIGAGSEALTAALDKERVAHAKTKEALHSATVRLAELDKRGADVTKAAK